MSMNKPWKVVLVFVGVFVAGAIAGGPLAMWVQNYRHERRPPFVDRTMERYERELQISEAQRGKIWPVLLRAQTEWRALREENVRKMSEVIDRMHAEVAAELTPEQQTKLEKMRQELRARAERLRGRAHDREERQDRRQRH